MWLPTRSQVDSASRHAITIVSTAAVIFGLQAKGIDVAKLTAAIQAMGPAINDLVTLAGALGTVYAMLKASHSASPTSQIAAVGVIAQDNSQVESPSAKVALLNATASVLADPKTSPNSSELKVALLDATAAMPEVVGNINVTDSKLVDAATSNQVVKQKE